jgi:hypothetical protein
MCINIFTNLFAHCIPSHILTNSNTVRITNNVANSIAHNFPYHITNGFSNSISIGFSNSIPHNVAICFTNELTLNHITVTFSKSIELVRQRFTKPNGNAVVVMDSSCGGCAHWRCCVCNCQTEAKGCCYDASSVS